MPSFALTELENRIGKLQSLMTEHDVDAAIIVQSVDLYYLTGTAQDAHLIIPCHGDPHLLVRKSMERAVEDTPLRSVDPIRSLADVKASVDSSVSGAKTIGMELDILPVNNYRKYRDLFPGADIVDVSPLIREIRMLKSAEELRLMREAGRMNERMFSAIPEILQEGMTETEFSGLLEAYYRKLGHQGLVRVRAFNREVHFGHVMSGPNLSVPSCSVGPTGGPGPNPSMPEGAGLKVITKYEPIQVDLVAVVHGYLSDQARTFFLGDAPDKFLRIHDLAVKIQNRIAEQCLPGTRAEPLYETAVRMATDAGITEGFLGHPQPVPFVGHGVGLELDEFPILGRRSPHVIQEGMTIAIEPKFILPGEGLAGIENTHVVTAHGLERLNSLNDAIRVI